MTRSAHEQPIFQPNKLLIAVKFDPVPTNILDTIASQYKCFQTTPSSKPYIRVLIRRCFLPHIHPEYLDQHFFSMGTAEELKAFSLVLNGPYVLLKHQTNKKKVSSIRYKLESEELRAVRSAMLQKTQYIDLELRRIRRLKEYKSMKLRLDTLEQNWCSSITVGIDVPEDDGNRIAAELKSKYGEQLENVKAIGLSVSKGYHMMENGLPGGLAWKDFLFQDEEDKDEY
jgi:hypothetical protein